MLRDLHFLVRVRPCPNQQRIYTSSFSPLRVPTNTIQTIPNMTSSPPPKITHTHTLKLHLANPSDIPSITTTWYTCFPLPFTLAMFPDTPSGRKWWDDHNRHD